MTVKLSRTLALGAALCAFALPAFAQQQLISISSGTGFFVNRDGYIITNNHVVAHCKETPRVQGAVNLMPAQIISTDPANDLALLRASAVPVDYARLRAASPALVPGEALAVIGFPGTQGAQGVLVTQQAQLVSDKGPRGEDKWVQFTNSVQHGNSGGPLLDASGNVIGVIMAKSQTFFVNEVSAQKEKVGESDVAISLSTLKPFLEHNNVRYDLESSNNFLSGHRITDRARGFIVNIQCTQ